MLGEIKEIWKKSGSKEKLLAKIIFLIIIVSLIYSFIDNLLSKPLSFLGLHPNWIGFWGSMVGGLIAGAITLLSVKIAFNYSLEIQKNSNKHAEKIHKDALENARKMQLEQFKFERNRIIEQRLRYFQTYYDILNNYMEYLDSQKYTQNHSTNVYEGFEEEIISDERRSIIEKNLKGKYEHISNQMEKVYSNLEIHFPEVLWDCRYLGSQILNKTLVIIGALSINNLKFNEIDKKVREALSLYLREDSYMDQLDKLKFESEYLARKDYLTDLERLEKEEEELWSSFAEQFSTKEIL